MESGASNLVMSEIVESSIEEHILCDYTALLVLEPGFVPDIDPNQNPIITEEIFFDDMWWDINLPVSVKEPGVEDFALNNFPNPFIEFTTIQYNLVQEGTDILKEKLLSPLLRQNLNNFEVFVVADNVYRFGKVKEIK